jgi:branched-subunit amino acid transport protein AzlD
MKEFLSKYKIETGVLIAIFLVVSLPYFIINSGIIKSEENMQTVDFLVKNLTPIVMSILVAIIVYRAIKRNREDN